VTEVHVSDHAIVRFLERARGMDIQSVRNAIAYTVQEAVDAGACKISVSGLTYVIEGETVVTITPASRKP
jgi:hypothetical protein